MFFRNIIRDHESEGVDFWFLVTVIEVGPVVIFDRFTLSFCLLDENVHSIVDDKPH